MKIYCLNESCAAFSAEKGEILCCAEAEKLIRSLITQNNMVQWVGMSVDVFCCEEEYLYVARPLNEIKIRLADYALPFISEYFTE